MVNICELKSDPEWDFPCCPALDIPTDPEWDFPLCPALDIPTDPAWPPGKSRTLTELGKLGIFLPNYTIPTNPYQVFLPNPIRDIPTKYQTRQKNAIKNYNVYCMPTIHYTTKHSVLSEPPWHRQCLRSSRR